MAATLSGNIIRSRIIGIIIHLRHNIIYKKKNKKKFETRDIGFHTCRNPTLDA